jgi:hypothetical protein
MNISRSEFVDAVAEALGRFSAVAPPSARGNEEPWHAVPLSMAAGSLALQRVDVPGFELVFSAETIHGAVGDVFAEVFFDSPDTNGPTVYLRPGESIRHPRGFGYFWVRATAQGSGYANPWSLLFYVARDPLATYRGRERPAGNGMDPLNTAGQVWSTATSGYVLNAALNSVLVSTGPLAAGDYEFDLHKFSDTTATNFNAEIEHRDAADAATVASLGRVNCQISSGHKAWELGRYRLVTNERVRVVARILISTYVQFTLRWRRVA